ncbi:MAG: hypothetical protein IPM07_30255 [Anaerolineales bacterium]|nr:hypothetical protein [Anaerolineales bacterium]
MAAILNITPNHLDRHADMTAYAAAKFNLLRCLPDAAAIVLSAEDAVTPARAEARRGLKQRPASQRRGGLPHWTPLLAEVETRL